MASHQKHRFGPHRVARRIRVKSILLSSYRRNPNAWMNWLRFEGFKGAAPAFALLAVRIVGLEAPPWLFWIALIWFGIWNAFVLSNAIKSLRKLDRRRDKFLKDAGFNPQISSLLRDPHAWRQTLGGGPPKKFIKWYLQRKAAGSPPQ